MLDLATVATAFAVILPVELPDKTFIATLVLSTRLRPLFVWIGVASAFAVHTAIAVLAGGLLTLLPRTPILLAAAALFAVGAVLLWRQASSAQDAESAEREEIDAKLARYSDIRGFKAVGVSFAVLMLAEWGDLSQLFTAGLAARSGEPLSVFVGAWSALALVSGLAAALGRVLLARMPIHLIQRIAAGICALLAVLTLIEVF
ncbi:MAG: TMEM165/GDT1 family protein [Actinomycetales bacterium]